MNFQVMFFLIVSGMEYKCFCYNKIYTFLKASHFEQSQIKTNTIYGIKRVGAENFKTYATSYAGH